jgi:hypothetical protein
MVLLSKKTFVKRSTIRVTVKNSLAAISATLMLLVAFQLQFKLPVLHEDAADVDVESDVWYDGNEVPPILYFIHTKMDILADQKPVLFYENIQRTVRQYERAWGKTNLDVRFLTFESCRELVRHAAPDLLPHFDADPEGRNHATICRVAALYVTGGYYFDVDMLTQRAWLPRGCSLATAFNPWNNIMQSILIAQPAHPLLKETFRVMLVHYEEYEKMSEGIERTSFHFNLGTKTLRIAYDNLHYQAPPRCFLRESKLNPPSGPRIFPDLPLQKGAFGGGCNFVIHNDNEVFFYSRIVGAGRTCRFTQEKL